ncbi:MAG: PAS domain S-box protein [Candidatus Cyclobacteriaceae bacterium M3_2C_046]
MKKSTNSSKPDQLYLVGIGASAGGLESISSLLSHIPTDITNVALVIAQHLSPTYKSMLTQLLSKETSLKVVEVKDGMKIEERTIYITPPDSEITVTRTRLKLGKPKSSAGPKPSVDVLFKSISEAYGENSIGVILSGTGSDGSTGVRHIKAEGGLVIVQEPKSAKYNGMPIAAIDSGQADLILSPDKIGKELGKLSNQMDNFNPRQPLNIVDESSTDLEKIFKLLTRKTGTDFSNYKHSTFCRRLEKRLSVLNFNSLEKYLNYIDKNPHELDALFNTILIGVTSFFRDKEAFDKLILAIQKIIESKNPGDPIRFWIPGCATGEEAYTIAIVLTQLLQDKIDDFKIQIFATDIDERAVKIGRRGIYSPLALENVEPEIREQYFLKKGSDFELIKQVRSLVLFSKHDVISNPPFLKLDLISCRNLLIYFGANLQKQVFPVFHYSLNENGYLFLGKSETVGHFSHLFSVFDNKYKIYKKKWVGKPNHSLSLTSIMYKNSIFTEENLKRREEAKNLTNFVKDTIYQTYDHPYIVITEDLEVKEIKGNIRDLIGLNEGNVNLNILKLIHKNLQLELRKVINRSIKENTVVKGKVNKYVLYDTTYYLRIIVKPININIDSQFYLVIFENLELEDILKDFYYPNSSDNDGESMRIKELEHELALTKENLQTYLEEVETSNEELQSLNEELQSTNEELQSSNEELETSNEELHSTNEEIQIAYGELKAANDSLEKKDKLLIESESNIKALLNNHLFASFLLNKDIRVVTFNSKAKEVFKTLFKKKLSHNDSLLDIFEGNNLNTFHTNFKKALNGKSPQLKHKFTGSDGEDYFFQISFAPVKMANEKVERVALSMMDITEESKIRTELSNSEKLLKSIFNATSVGLCVTDKEGNYLKVNHEYCRIYGFEPEELIGKTMFDTIPLDQRKSSREWYSSIFQEEIKYEKEIRIQQKNGSMLDVFISTVTVELENGEKVMVSSVGDISESKKFRELLIETQESAQVGGWELDLITNLNTWTDEVYNIYEVSKEFNVNVENGLKFYESKAVSKLENALRNAIEKGEHFDIELPFISAKGNHKWVRATCKPLRVRHRTIKLYGTIQDITARKKHEEKLFRITKAVENASDAIQICDMEGNSIYINESYKTLMGFSKQSQPSTNFFKIHENKELAKQIFEILKSGGSWKGDITVVNKNSKNIPAFLRSDAVKDENGMVIGMIAVFHDNSTKRKHEEYLKLMESVVVNTNDAVIITESINNDQEGDRIIFVNDAFTRMTGYSRNEIIGITHRILHGPRTSREELAKLGKALRRRESAQAELVNYRKDGSEIWVDISVVPIKNEYNQVTHFVSIQRDVTGRKNAETELKKNIEQLEKTNSELDKFVYSASHDLRAPLSSVLGLINLVKMDEKETHHIEYLRNMEISIKKLDGFISEIIKYSRNTRLDVELEMVEINEIVDEIKQEIKYLDNAEKINIYTKNPDKFEFFSDKSRLRVVLSNLISNAVKYHKPNTERPYIKVAATRNNGKVILHIEDNGSGISKEHQEKIFNMFYRASETSKGSGLGLYIVKETLEKLKGKISVQSHIGEGSTFTVELPVLDLQTNGQS